MIYKCHENQENWLPWLLIKMRINEYMFNATEWEKYFVLTSHYSIAINILTTRSCLVILIVNVSQINWLSGQIGFLVRYLEFQSKL